VVTTLRASYVKRCGSALLTCLLIETIPIRSALAEDDAAETAAARTLAVDGLKLADAGRCAEAIEKLARAEKLHHAPIVLGRLGECQITQGKLVDGTENLRKVLREPMPANPSFALTKARERAQTTLDAAKPKIAILAISIKGPRDNSAVTVTVDGQSVSSALLDAERPTDPGEHVVEATAQGFLKASSRVIVGPGDRQSVNMKLDPDPNAPATLPADAPNAPARTGSTSELGAPAARDTGATTAGTGGASAPNHSGAYISWAFGGAALAVGAGFGAIAIKDKNDLASSCKANVCPVEVEGKLNSAKTAGTISTIGLGLGAAGVVLGTILYFTAGSGTSTGNRAQSPRAASGWKPRAWVGVGQAGFGADF
jgi:hypothetical protein